MEVNLSTRIKNAWNAFSSSEQRRMSADVGYGYSYDPTKTRRLFGHDKSIVTSVYNRIATDAASIDIKHVQLDANNRFLHEVNSHLNSCLTLSANLDQTGRALIQDAVMSMMDEGVVAIVPIDTDINPELSGSYDILSMRVGRIIEWMPNYIRVSVYNEKTGNKQEILVSKRAAAIVENPFYAVMNEPNSTMQRLIHKLNLLDAVDEQSSAGKLDLIIQLPYVIKSDARREQAEKRRKDIEMQLAGSKYGIAYTDGTERVTQLNRPIENNLMKQIEYLTTLLYSQLGITQAVMDGTADEKVMLNYFNRTIEPIMSAIVDEMKRKFLTQTARTRLQSIEYFRDPFRLVPVSDIAEVADKFTRNEIMSSNEIRQVIGMKPSSDPRADELRNKNLNAANDQLPPEMTPEQEAADGEIQNEQDDQMSKEEFETQMKDLDNLDLDLDDLEDQLGEPELKHYASPYYDPVKAHEYYMKHQKLHPRDLNEEGRNAARYVKERLREEYKGNVKASSDRKKSNLQMMRERHSDKVSSEREAVSRRADTLKNMLKNMTPEQKAAKREEFSAEIADMREHVSGLRERLRESYGKFKEFEDDKHVKNKERFKADYDQKLEAEMEKIGNEASFQKPKKRKRSS